MKRFLAAVLGIGFVLSGCAGTGALPPSPAAEGENRYLVDPRTGAPGPSDPSLDRRFDAAWRFFVAGDDTNARLRLEDVRRRNPAYAPAMLLQSAIDLRQGKIDAARNAVLALERQYPEWTVVRAYEAEIALANHQTRRAWEIYRDLSLRPDATATTRERLADVEKRLFDELYHAALSASDAEAIAALREALIVSPNATGARILLAQKLISQKQYDEARASLEPLISSSEADRAEVQEALAEIEVGRGQFEPAIVRYERLARRESDPRFARRLEQVKEQWNAANMPPQYQRALLADAITRADFAVLLYWLVPSVRFAQNLNTPPIAIDLADVSGRDEIVRAIALGILQVDPVTRRVRPDTLMNEAALERLTSRVLILRGATCARGVPADGVMSACGITTTATTPDALVTGHDASLVLQQVANALAK